MKKLLAVVLSLVLALGLGASALAKDESEILEKFSSFIEKYYPEEYSKLEADLDDILGYFDNGSHDELDLPLIKLLLTELTDDDTFDDFEALYHFLRLLVKSSYEPIDLINVLKTIAVTDALDDDSDDDYENVLDFIELVYDSYALDSDENIDDELAEILSAITDESFFEPDQMIPEMLLSELTDNLNIDDLDLMMRIVELCYDNDLAGKYTGEIRELLKTLALLDYYDDVNDDDFNLVLENMRMSDGEFGGTQFNDAADEVIHLAAFLNPEGIEYDPLAE